VAAVDGTALVVVERGVEREAKRGHPVVSGATVVTANDSTVMLARRGDSILLYPNSRMTVADAVDGDPLGTVQSYGMLLYRMETHRSRNFEVRTPFLSATATGTVFTVDVAADRATVSVAEGMVRVVPAGGGKGDVVRAGSRASVSAANTSQVTMETVDPADASFWSPGRARRGAAPDQPGGTGSEHGKSSRGNSDDGDSDDGESQGGGSQGGGSQGGGSQGGGSQDGGSQGGGSQGGGNSRGGNARGNN